MDKYYLRSDNGVIGLMPVSLLGMGYCIVVFFGNFYTTFQLITNVVMLIIFTLVFLAALLHYFMAKSQKVYIGISDDEMVKRLWTGTEYKYDYNGFVKYVYHRNKKTLKAIILCDNEGKKLFTVTNSYDISLDKTKVHLERKWSNEA